MSRDIGLALVTGATGFIGAHLVHRLLAAGANVRALVRPRWRGASLPFPPDRVDLVWGDVTDAASVYRAVHGVDTVFHLAAHASAWARSPSVFDTVNRGGTALVCDAALRHGIRRVVHVSTELAADSVPLLTPYQVSKRAAEAVVQGIAARGGDAVIVRPTRVFGPGAMTEANALTRLIDLHRRGLFRFRVADGGVRANYVYVDDVARGIVQAACRGRSGATYYLGGANYSVGEFLELIDRATQRRRIVVVLPVPAALAVATLSEWGAHLGVPPVVTRAWLRLFLGDRPISSHRAEQELDYRPGSVVEAIETTVRWLAAGRPNPFAVAPSASAG